MKKISGSGDTLWCSVHLVGRLFYPLFYLILFFVQVIDWMSLWISSIVMNCDCSCLLWTPHRPEVLTVSKMECVGATYDLCSSALLHHGHKISPQGHSRWMHGQHQVMSCYGCGSNSRTLRPQAPFLSTLLILRMFHLFASLLLDSSVLNRWR